MEQLDQPFKQQMLPFPHCPRKDSEFADRSSIAFVENGDVTGQMCKRHRAVGLHQRSWWSIMENRRICRSMVTQPTHMRGDLAFVNHHSHGRMNAAR
ncbi:hypothetical protein Nepgr_008519 [Nepenthes gracilis]|uniref:Uncharacterized protein n=1 Tax=Nepenthes gracilis TaxID=150966 RepID=A0AAD3S951_NEPGR|nr:hypothetical protein Nepgr_008519 [Nepenthes gracilis]